MLAGYLEDFNAGIYTELSWIPVSARLQGKKMKDAADGAGLNGHVTIY